MTQEATALGQESEAAPATPGPFTAQEEAAPQEAATEDAPSPEATETETPEAPWHHAVESDDALFGHETFKGRREALQESGRSEGRLQAQKDVLPLMDEAGPKFDGFTQQLSSLVGRLNKAANDGQLDGNAVDSLLAGHGLAFQAMNKVLDEEYQGRHRQDAYKNYLELLAQDLNDSSLVGEFSGRLPFAARGMDRQFIPDLRKRIIGNAVEEADKKGYKRGLAEGQALAASQQQVKQAQTTGPQGALVPGATAGGTYTAEQWTNMTTAQRNKARDEGKHPLYGTNK